MEPGSSLWCPLTGWEQIKGYKIPAEHTNPLFYREGDQILEQGLQKGSKVSILGDTWNPKGHGPGYLTPADSAWGKGVD